MPTQVAARLPGASRGRPSSRSFPEPARPVWRLVATCIVAFAVATAWVAGPATTARAGDDSAEGAARPGAYCRLPEPGQKPVCLGAAEAAYGDFFAAVDRGQMPSAEAIRVEADLAGVSGTERAYLALSSLSYGYYRLAEQAGARPDAAPALLARLERWNELLIALYGASQKDPRFRAAVREAADDLHTRTPSMESSCPNRYPGGCRQTADLVQALAAVDDTAGVRSPLGQLLRRMFGLRDVDEDGESEDQP